MSDKLRLAELLLEKSFRTGEFKLTSGRTSDYYFDCKPTALHPEGVNLIGNIFMDMIKDLIHGQGIKVHGVAGMTLGADPLVSAVTLISWLNDLFFPGIIVRKQSKGHGTNQFLEGLGNFQTGDNVVMLEDVVTTGGTLIKAIDRVKEGGLNVVGVLAVLDRQEGGLEALAAAGYELRSIFTAAELKAIKAVAGSTSTTGGKPPSLVYGIATDGVFL